MNAAKKRGYVEWSRQKDGEKRWIYWPAAVDVADEADIIERMLWLEEEARVLLRHAFVVFVAALVWFLT